MKRASDPASTTTRLVDPTSVTTVSGPACSSAARTVSARAPTGVATKTTSAPSTAPRTSRARSWIAPSSSALEAACSSGSYPATSAPARRPAASPIDPPISPRPRTATLKASALAGRPAARRLLAAAGSPSDGAERLARQHRSLLDGGHVLREAVRAKRLRAVAHSLLGVRVRLYDDAVRARGSSRQGHRLHELAAPRRVA